MASIDHIKPIDQRRSASERVAERLTGLIASGNIAPGDKLPSENELSKALRVSRPVVREALRGLAMMGIVESKQGGGCFVTDLQPNRLMAPFSFVLSLHDYSLEALFRARDVIDVGIAGDAARNATAEQLGRLQDLAEAGFNLVDDPVGFRVMDSEFHELIGEAADNAFLDRVSRSLYSMAIESRRRASAQPGVLAQSAKDHAAIVAAIAARDADAAGAAMAAHVAHICKTTLAAMEKTPPDLRPV